MVYKCAGRVEGIHAESGIGGQSSIFGLFCCVHFRTNGIQKSVSSPINELNSIENQALSPVEGTI